MRKTPTRVEGPQGYNFKCECVRDEDCFGLLRVLNILAFHTSLPLSQPSVVFIGRAQLNPAEDPVYCFGFG